MIVNEPSLPYLSVCAQLFPCANASGSLSVSRNATLIRISPHFQAGKRLDNLAVIFNTLCSAFPRHFLMKWTALLKQELQS